MRSPDRADTAEEVAEKQTPDASGAEVRPASFNVPPARADRRQTCDLHVCPCCDSELVYPLEWVPEADRGWTLSLRCPDCEWRGGGTYGQSVLDRFDEALDRATEQMLDDLNLLSRANMEEQIERFAAALEAGRILPEDF